MSRADLAFVLGVLCASLAGFLSPLFCLGFLPLAAALLWVSYDLTEVDA